MSVAQSIFERQASLDQEMAIETMRLTDQQKASLTQILSRFANPYINGAEFTIHAMSAFCGLLDSRSLAKILAFAVDPAMPGVMAIDNLPYDTTLVDTPEDGEPSKDQKQFIGEACVLGLAKLLGEPVGYLTEKGGNLIHNIIPVRGAETTQSNRSSKAFLNFHNDSVYDQRRDFHRFNPDFILLYCARPDLHGQAKTYYADAREIVARASKTSLAVLQSPLFLMAAPSNYTVLMNKGEKVWSDPMPILRGSTTYPEIVMGANGVQPTTPEAEKAHEELLGILKRPECLIEIALRKGQMLLINNRKGVHARSSFTPSFGPEERWLLRANVRRDIWSMRDRWTGSGMVFD